MIQISEATKKLLSRALIVACENKDYDVVQGLINLGADVNFRWDVQTVCNTDPETSKIFKGDDPCPMDIALGYVGKEYFRDSDYELFKILVSTVTHDFGIALDNDRYSTKTLEEINQMLFRYKLELKLKSKDDEPNISRLKI